MAGLSDFLENELNDHYLKVGAYTQPTNVYTALYTAAPSDAGGGTEVSGGSYARVVMNSWDVSVAGASENTSAITYAAATGSWGTVTHVGLFDAITTGNLLGWAALDASQAVISGNTVEFAAGAIDVTLD